MMQGQRYLQSGFTLIEVMVAGLLLFVAIGLASVTYQASLKTDMSAQNRIREAVHLRFIEAEIKEQLRQNPLLKMGEVQSQSGDYAWAITQTFSKNAKAGFDTETGSDIGLGKQLILHQLSVELEREPHEFVYLTWQ